MRRKLLLNLNAVAGLRELSGASEPDPAAAAILAMLAGADGVTLHLREDRLDAQDRDARLLRQTLSHGYTLELSPTSEMLKVALEVRPDAVTLVPELVDESVPAGGLDVMMQLGEIGEIVRALGDSHMPASLLIEPAIDQVKAAHRVGAEGVFVFARRAADPGPTRADELRDLGDAVALAAKLGLRVGVGWGVNYANVEEIASSPQIGEVRVGRAVTARAMLSGMERAVAMMRALL